MAALVFLFLVYVFSFGMRRNFRRIMATIDQLASGQLSARAQVGARDELGHLASQLGDMAASLEKVVGQVAGLAALVKEVAPQIGGSELQELLVRTGNQVGNTVVPDALRLVEAIVP